MKPLTFVILMLVSISACRSKKPQAEQSIRPAPAWTQSKPIDPLYYHGIGISTKHSFSSNFDFKQVAKNNALNDLASEISVKVNASSLLSQIEVNRHVSESFVANTTLTSTEELEGFELVDTYENETNYFVFYRLSKEEHERRKALRRQRALSAAADFLISAEEFRTRKDAYQAYLMYIKAMETIKGFWAEPLEYTLGGERIFFGNHLISRTINLLNEIQIQSATHQIQAVRGRPIDDENTEVYVTFQNIRQKSIPLRMIYSGGRIRNSTQKTNAAGSVFFDIGRINSTNPRERITVNINIEAWTLEATQNQQIISLLSQIRLRPYTIELVIQSPLFFIESDEKALGRLLTSTPLADVLKVELSKDQFVTTQRLSDADFIVMISADTEEAGLVNQMSSVNLSFRIQITDPKNQVIYTRNVRNIRGMHTDALAASRDAYSKASRLIQRELYLEIRRNFIE